MTSFALPLRSAPGVFFIFLFYFNYLVPVWALPPGVYAIINNVFSHEDEALVITFNGINEPVTVTVWTDDPAQHVRVYYVVHLIYIYYICSGLLRTTTRGPNL